MSRLTTAPALAASLAVTALLLAACGGTAQDDAADAGSDAPEAASLQLTVPATPATRCMMPNVDNLKAQDTAFEGIVTTVTDGTATLEVTESFKGSAGTTANVSAPSQDLQDLLIAVDFEEGQTYLVSSLDGQVSVCGLSGPKDEQLADLYEQAYTG